MADNFEHEELDFFEANNTFKEMLKRNLSASQIARITDFAYQYSAYADTLFSTLMEVLQETPVLQRLNCFYVIDNIFKHKLKANSDCYFIPIKANLEQIVYIVIDCQPNALENDKSIQSEGFVNVASVKKVLALWKLKKLISPGRHDDLAAFLTSCSELASSGNSNVPKENVIRRMEEDRDRQKRSREFAWIRGGPENIESPTAPTYDQEFLDAWEKAQPLTPAVEKQFKKYDEEFIYLVTADDHPKQINDNLQY